MPDPKGGPELPLGEAAGVAKTQVPDNNGHDTEQLRITVTLRDDILALFKTYRTSHAHLRPPDSLLVGALCARGLVSFFQSKSKASTVLALAEKAALATLSQTLK